MRGLRAAIRKDIKLFFSGAGLVSLLLPLLLIPALRLGMGDLSGQSYMRSFPIAVRDLDGTLMSRSLLSQLRELQLFSQVRTIAPDETDQQALAEGAAAAVTIPRDFFYDMYSMEDCPVTVTLNDSMPLESAVFQAIFRSVMAIVQADQTAQLGRYEFLWGELTPERLVQLYKETSLQLFQDALGRQQVFAEAVEQTDLASALQRRLLACVLSVCAIFFALSAARTLPEETALGILPRFRSVGGHLAAFLLSKLCAAFVLTVPVLVPAALLFPGTRIWSVLALDGLLVWAAFGLLTAVAAWVQDAAAVQRWGNILLLVSLTAGGTLWPRPLLPAPLAWLGKLTLPYYGALALDAQAQGLDPGQLCALLWPLPVMGAAGLLLAAPGFRRRVGQRLLPPRGPSPSGPEPAAMPRTGISRRTARLGLFKLRVMSGGVRGLAATLAAGLLCGFAAAAVRDGGARSLRLGLCDLDGSELSAALTASIASEDGLRATVYDTLDQARRAVLTGEEEGILVIEPGYAQLLADSDETALRYESASSSLAGQGAREIAAGKAAGQKSRLRALSLTEQDLGRTLTGGEREELLAAIDRAADAIPVLYHIDSASGAPLADPFVPGPMSFAALAALFTLLTAAAWCGSDDSRSAASRMGSLPGGRAVSFGSDAVALTLLGLLIMAAALLPGGDLLRLLPAAAAYTLAAAALALLLARFTALAGRVDALAPFLALLVCLVGGCFLDLAQLSPAMLAVSLLSPAGLAVRASQGNWAALAVLPVLAAALFAAAALPRDRS